MKKATPTLNDEQDREDEENVAEEHPPEPCHDPQWCALTIDDEIDTAGSLVGAVKTLLEHGATEVFSCCTHPVFSGPAIERISKSPVKQVVVTDTLPTNERKSLDKIKVLSIAPLFGEAINRIHTGMSIGALFE